MGIRVEIFPWLSSSIRPGIVGSIKLEHQLSGACLRDLMEELAEGEPAVLTLLYDREKDELRYPVKVAVNDKLVDFNGGMDAKISNGDHVIVMAAYTGG
jgi:molybdopterin converting factor small subunit